MRPKPWCLVAGVIVAGGACTHRHGASSDAGAQPINPVHVTVTNRYTLPVDVFAVSAGTSYRMGTVSPGMSSTFALRQGMLEHGTVEFIAQPAGGESPVRSGQLLLAPGDLVEFEIATHLLNSTAIVHH